MVPAAEGGTGRHLQLTTPYLPELSPVVEDAGMRVRRGWFSCTLPSMAQVAEPLVSPSCSDR
jgi:hypothetical protein